MYKHKFKNPSIDSLCGQEKKILSGYRNRKIQILHTSAIKICKSHLEIGFQGSTFRMEKLLNKLSKVSVGFIVLNKSFSKTIYFLKVWILNLKIKSSNNLHRKRCYFLRLLYFSPENAHEFG